MMKTWREREAEGEEKEEARRDGEEEGRRDGEWRRDGEGEGISSTSPDDELNFPNSSGEDLEREGEGEGERKG